MSEICSWPRCKLLHKLLYVVENKRYGFCDKHWDMIMSEDDAQMARARKKMKMPMPRRLSTNKPEPKPEPEPKTKPTTTEDVDDFDTENFQKMLQSGEFN